MALGAGIAAPREGVQSIHFPIDIPLHDRQHPLVLVGMAAQIATVACLHYIVSSTKMQLHVKDLRQVHQEPATAGCNRA